jgi:transcriptional regulator with XRE-family HTH domain
VELGDIARTLRTCAEELGLGAPDIAARAQCSALDVARLLSGEPTATVGVLAAVADSLGFVILSVPKPAVTAIAAGFEVTEPKVQTVVAAALERINQAEDHEGDTRSRS